MRCTPSIRFSSNHGLGPVFLLTIKVEQQYLDRQIANQLLGRRRIPFAAEDHEDGHGRDIKWPLWAKQAPEMIKQSWHGTIWIEEVSTSGTREGRTFGAPHLYPNAAHHPRRPAATPKRSLED